MTRLLFIFFIMPFLCQNSLAQSIAQKFADSEIKRFPEAWQLDHGKRLYWGYAQGVGTLAMLKVWERTGDEKYFTYVERWADTLINDKGEIHLYKPETYNLDYINPGKVLFALYEKNHKEKYKLAMDRLVAQLKEHPRTSEGGFWHKQIYPHQMWLDGIYMASPFLAQYAQVFNKPEMMDDVITQVLICAKHTRDPKTGLYYHAWDESKTQKWANKETGQSPNFWGRSIGWWYMALVDVLDYLPKNHPKRAEIVGVVRNIAEVLPEYMDKDGLFYQILDKPKAKGNYAEASVNSMFMYAYAKAVNKGYINKKYNKVARRIYHGLLKKLVKVNNDGTLTLIHCNAVAGLGGNPYRDGSFNYYINERIRDNDAKATGPFIMGCLELNQ